MTKLLDKFSLIVEHSKTEVFDFNRLYSFFNPSPLDLSSICDVICKFTHSEIISPWSNHTSPPSMAAIFLTTCLRAVLQPFGYSVFHNRNTSSQLGLL